ncbi:MAG: radical SAM protein [Lachnospiraceae bacterium]|nr:radical SAM protein [Lachnospiraceae bacterium]
MQTYETLRQLHPCLGERPGNNGRIHLPVSPICNLSCRYCKRSLTDTAQRPGTSRRILSVEDTVKVIRKARLLCPELTTVGIAGPGEALASPHAIEAFRLVDEHFPDMIKCLSTNGLMLNEKAEELLRVHMDSVTVTVNAVEPSIQTQINKRIFFHNEWMDGEEAAGILIENQLAGIKKLSEAGVTVKINTVLIPGINDKHIETIAKTVAENGAKIYNIIPLIPQADMAKIPAPGCDEIDRARLEAGQYLDIFSHCRHCRADAVGKLGEEDYGQQIYGNLALEPAHFSHG